MWVSDKPFGPYYLDSFVAMAEIDIFYIYNPINDRFVSNFDWGTRKTNGNVLRESLVCRHNWAPKLVVFINSFTFRKCPM